jgi:hypothetical protein
VLRTAYAGMLGLGSRGAHPGIAAWNESCRLNPSAGAAAKAADPKVADAFGTLVTHINEAMRNLAERTSVNVPEARSSEGAPAPAS